MRFNAILISFLCVLTIQCVSQKPTVEPLKKTEEKMPHFTGGDNAFYDYLDKNVKIPEGFDAESYMKKHGNQFIPISVGFTIDVDGSINNVIIIDGENEALNEKAIQIVKKMPNWVPGSQNGKPVKVQYAIPIRFNLKS